MLKNLLTAAAAMLLTAGSAFAQVTIGSNSYNTLNDAVSAAYADEATEVTINIAGATTVTSRVNLNGTAKTINIVGSNNASIVRGEKYNNGLVLLVGNGNIVNISDVTFDGNNVSASQPMLEINDGAPKTQTITLKDCKFVNAISTHNNGLFKIKSYTTLENVSVENCTVNEGRGDFLVGLNERVTVKGTANYSLYVESTYRIMAENVSGKIDVILQNNNTPRTFIKDYNDASVFNLVGAPEGYGFEVVNNNVELTYNKYVVTNETTGVSYTSLPAAINASEENQVLVVLEDLVINDRIDNKNYTTNKNRNLVIKGADPDNKITLTKNFKNKLFVTNNGWLTFENIIFDCNEQENDKAEIENNVGNLILNNVEIKNSVSTKGLIDVKGSRTTTLNGVLQSNCNASVPGVNLGGSLALNGNNNLSVNVTNQNPGAVYVVADGELTNEEPIVLTLANTELGSVVVNGTIAYKKFSLTNEGFYLNPDKENNNIVLADKVYTGIEDINAEGVDAPAEYYNINGMRVNADSLTPGIYVKRQGGKAIKVLVK